MSLAEFVQAKAEEFGVPGAAVGVWADGEETFACHGVTSVVNPLPVDENTMFVVGSVSKTITATAVMRLVAEGKVDLDAPVRRYVPELRLSDEQAAADITVLRLLNHTAGLDWRMNVDTGQGDDALAAYVARMADSPLIAPPGTRSSYSQVGFNLAGRIIEKVTGLTFAQAVKSLLIEPLGMTDSHYSDNDAMTRRFSVGHNVAEDGTISVARQWNDNRANEPGGALASTVADQLRWARFHLGDGGDLLPAKVLQQMKEPTVELHGSTLGDAMGICWFLREIDGVGTVGHGGSANGQFAELLLVPERDFAVVVMSNVGPDGGLALNREVIRWALEHYLGVVDRDPEPLPFDETAVREVAGSYANDMMFIIFALTPAGLTAECVIKPEVRAAATTEMPPNVPPAAAGLLPGDEYIVLGGGMKGLRGRFTRDDSGAVTEMDMAGRVFTRV